MCIHKQISHSPHQPFRLISLAANLIDMTLGNYFGDYLTQLVRAVDIVNNDIRESILIEIEEYLKSELHVMFFTFLIKQIERSSPDKAEDRTTLCTTDWYKGGTRTNSRLTNNQGEYIGQVSLAFAEDLSLWIVGKESEQLRHAATYLELMNNITSSRIPKYVSKTQHPIHTSIIIPVSLSEQSETVGVVNFESTIHMTFNQAAWEELNKIAKSIAILYDRNQTYSALREETKRATKVLSRYRNSKLIGVSSQRKSIFVAYSSRADRNVVGNIIRILNHYEVDVVLWSDISESGIITQPLFRKIQDSDYGLCYLSEPVLNTNSDQRNHYIDNPNVLFEAGMLSGRSSNMENWIPLREKDSEKMPFDISGVRTLFVDRRQHNGKNVLNEPAFEQQLKGRLDSLLGI